MSNDDLVWLFRATAESFDAVRDIHRKTSDQIDGEVYTSLRRMVRSSSGTSMALKNMVIGKKKFFTTRVGIYASDKQQEILIKMYNTLKRHKMLEEPDALAELTISLLSMRASLRRMEEVVARAVEIRKGIDEVPKILNGEENARS